MMYFEDSKYKDMLEVCVRKYGDESGTIIYQKAQNFYKQFLDEANYRESEIIKSYMQNNIFPVLAYYMSLLNFGIDQKQAYADTLEQTQRYAQIEKEKNKALGSMFGAYFMFRMAAKKVMAMNFPVEGWETEWVRCDRHEVHFNLKRCSHSIWSS